MVPAGVISSHGTLNIGAYMVGFGDWSSLAKMRRAVRVEENTHFDFGSAMGGL